MPSNRTSHEHQMVLPDGAMRTEGVLGRPGCGTLGVERGRGVRIFGKAGFLAVILIFCDSLQETVESAA